MPPDLFATAVAIPVSPHDVWTVSRLNQDVKQLLDTSFGLLWLQGEVSNFSRPASGHFYFSMKDSLAQIRCAMFKNRNRYLDFIPENGMQILARGRLGLYEARGEYQFVIEHIEEFGSGALQRQFEQRFEKLKLEGLFDEENKQPLPRYPQRIGIISSSTGAALQDILDVLGRRYPVAEVLVYPTPVQGESAANKIAAQISRASGEAYCDILLLSRGGGSMEDLWAFNEENVARAVAACTVPLICGVGHETDFTLADFAADVRAPTPSAAAELACPDQVELAGEFRTWLDTLRSAVTRRLSSCDAHINALTKRLEVQHPERQMQQRYQRCDELTARLARAIAGRQATRTGRLRELQLRLAAHSPQHTLTRKRGALEHATGRLRAALAGALTSAQSRLRENMHALHIASPMATLERGYSITRKSGQLQPLISVESLTTSDEITTRLSDGTATSKITHTERLPKR